MKSPMYCVIFWRILIIFLWMSHSAARIIRKGRGNAWEHLLIELNTPRDMKQFLVDSYQQMGDIDCLTIIWDRASAPLFGSVTFCLPQASTCAYKYIIHYNGGEITEELVKALRSGYREQCRGYIILLKNPRTVTDLLHYGDDNRVINTRARFLIWYQDKSDEFEHDDVWKKIPNAILFNTTLNTRTRHLSFTILEIKWPASTDDSTGVKEQRVHAIDFWRYGKGLKNDIAWYFDKTKNLKNITLKVLVVEHPPGVIKYRTMEGDFEYAGIEIDLVKALSDIMNFQIEYVDADTETKWGGEVTGNNTTSFYGAVGTLIDGETDMGIGSFFILKHYLDFLDMSIPIDVACTSFLTPTPLARPRYLALILPFNYQLWILVVLICFIFAPLLLYGLTHFKYHVKEFAVFSEKIHVVLTSFRLMTQVALHIWPKYWPVRVFIGWYWLFTLLISLAYRGAMVSFLTIPLFEAPIDNINDLYASGLRLGGWGKELHNLFTQHQADTKESAVKAALSNKYEMIEDLENGINMVAAGTFALYENVRFLKFLRQTRNLTRTGAPSMRVMKQCIVPVHIGIAYHKNSAITRTINGHIRRFRESGLTTKWGARLIQLTKAHDRSKYRKKSNREGDEDGDDDEESTKNQRKQRVLTVADLQGSVYLILFGVFLSIIAFIVELTIAHAHKATRNVNRKLKEIVDLTVTKTRGIKGMIDDRRFLLEYEAQFQSKLRQRKRGKNKKLLKKQPPFPYID